MLRLLLLASALVGLQGHSSSGLAAASLAAQRMASGRAVQLHPTLHPGHACRPNGGDWHTDVVAFPAGRADRIYIFGAGAASAYQIRSGEAVLVWCGQAIDTPQGGWNPSSTVLRALTFPLRTVSGTLPVERALDVYTGFAGHLTTITRNAAGKVTCARERFDEHEPRAAFQFDARDTCP